MARRGTAFALAGNMHALDQLIPTPRLLEIDHVEIQAPPNRVWEAIRHGRLGNTAFVRALFAIREIPRHLHGEPTVDRGIRIDDIVSSATNPGFQILVDEPPHEVAVGAIGKVWHLDIPFVHVDSAAAFTTFDQRDFIKVAWALRVVAHGAGSLVEIEVRVDATDDDAWRKFRRYFRVIGPASHFIRRSALSHIARELGDPHPVLGGDELLPDAAGEMNDAIDIAATPDAIWPWLVQMGCRRGGYYAIDALDNGGSSSAREIHPELQAIAVGDVLPAAPDTSDGFEVLRIEPHVALVLGGLFDPTANKQLPFAAARPTDYWQVTWAFVLEPLDAKTTRLHVRARAAFSPSERFHVAWIRPVHRLMQHAQLRHLAARAEGRVSRDLMRDVLDGVGGAAVMVAALFSPFLRGPRSHWGLDPAFAARIYPGDDVVAAPRWGWTHGVEIAAAAESVWPWIAQIGATRGGFYSYQWLENIAGCNLRNAETIHPDWQVKLHDAFYLHPSMPPLDVTHVERGRYFVVHSRTDQGKHEDSTTWAEMSWLFFVEPLGPNRCRVISRYRVDCSDTLAARLSFGPLLLEPIGFAMDRRMLLGVKERAEKPETRLRSNAPAVVGFFPP